MPGTDEYATDANRDLNCCDETRFADFAAEPLCKVGSNVVSAVLIGLF